MNAQIKTMTALVRRELWEHRSFWMVPSIMSALLTLLLMRVGFELLTEVPAEKIARINARVAESGNLADFMGQTQAAAMAFAGIGLTVGTVMLFVAFFYLLDSLYSDRRDRSILFWRSMPVTDTQTVLSKVLTVTVAGPLCVVGVLTGAFLVWGSIAAALGLAVGFDHWYIGLNPLAWLQAAAQILALVGGAVLIVAPFLGWLLLASAWAPRAPFLWATLPVVGVGMLEEMVFDSQHFAHTLIGHFEGLFPLLFDERFEGFGIRGDAHTTMRISGGIDLSPAFLAEPRLWVGVAIGVGLIALAIRARRMRDDAAY